jgi:hypothetical protein
MNVAYAMGLFIQGVSYNQIVVSQCGTEIGITFELGYHKL